MKHPSQEQLLHFITGRASDEEAEALFGHADACPACSERVEALRAIAGDFEGSWAEFLQEFDLRAGRLEAPATESAGWEMVVRGVLDGGRRLATLAAKGLSGMLGPVQVEPRLVPAYSGVGSPERTGAARLSQRASEHCARDRGEEALRILGELSQKDKSAAASGTLELRLEDDVVGRVVVDANRKSVSVLVNRDRLTGLTGWAVLRLEGTGEEHKVSLEAVEGAEYELAEFEDLQDGRFSIRIELRPC
jgi:hypothetical protein